MVEIVVALAQRALADVVDSTFGRGAISARPQWVPDMASSMKAVPVLEVEPETVRYRKAHAWLGYRWIRGDELAA